MEHTPGPWRFDQCTLRNDEDFRILWVARDMNGELYLGVQADDEPLIEAAPELLEALEPFAYLAQVMEEGQYLQFRGVYVSWEQAQAAAAAIAKARGEKGDDD